MGITLFCAAKEKSTVQFISNIRNINMQIKLKTHPMPKLQEIILMLDVFKCQGIILEHGMLPYKAHGRHEKYLNDHNTMG